MACYLFLAGRAGFYYIRYERRSLASISPIRQIFLPSYSAAGSRFINAESTKHTTGVHLTGFLFRHIFVRVNKIIPTIRLYDNEPVVMLGCSGRTRSKTA
ncbi:MAG: hypothetical protein EBE86_014145 [Hormoscilla sp. GUM202]|nr:hypothetical protein [Hormoscilla sp. GUM202]